MYSRARACKGHQGADHIARRDGQPSADRRGPDPAGHRGDSL